MSETLSEIGVTEEAAPTTPATSDAATQGASPDNSAASSTSVESNTNTDAPTLSALAEDPNDLSWVPEKYAVKNEAGELDHLATLKKYEEGRVNLEKRLGTGELAPKDIKEYKFDFGEEVAPEAIEQFVGNESIQSFITEAHKLGFTNSQLNFVLNSYIASVPDTELETKATVDNTVKALKQEWPTIVEYKENFAAADRALATYGKGVDVKAVMKDPAMVKILANVGKGLGESKVPEMPTIDPKTFDDQVAEIRASEAYNDYNHPQHNKAVERMTALHEARFRKHA